MAAPAYRSASSQETVQATSAPLTLPTGTAAGDLVFVMLAGESGIASTATPSGWTKGGSATTTGGTGVAWFWRVFDGAWAAPTFSWGGANLYHGWSCVAVSGVDTTAAVNVSNYTVQNTANTTPTSPSVTTTRPDTLLIWFAQKESGSGAITKPSAFTARVALTTNGGQTIATATQASAGATGTFAGSMSSDRWVAGIAAVQSPVLAIIPAGGATGGGTPVTAAQAQTAGLTVGAAAGAGVPPSGAATITPPASSAAGGGVPPTASTVTPVPPTTVTGGGVAPSATWAATSVLPTGGVIGGGVAPAATATVTQAVPANVATGDGHPVSTAVTQAVPSGAATATGSRVAAARTATIPQATGTAGTRTPAMRAVAGLPASSSAVAGGHAPAVSGAGAASVPARAAAANTTPPTIIQTVTLTVAQAAAATTTPTAGAGVTSTVTAGAAAAHAGTVSILATTSTPVAVAATDGLPPQVAVSTTIPGGRMVAAGRPVTPRLGPRLPALGQPIVCVLDSHTTTSRLYPHPTQAGLDPRARTTRLDGHALEVSLDG